jgi:hypothetical protein
MDKIKVPQSKFDEMGKIVSCQSIIETGKALGTVFFENTEFVITSAVGNGKGVGGWASVTGYRVIDKLNYKGILEPLLYDQHWIEVNAGKRERAYTGMLIKYNKRELVMIQPRTFIPDQSCVQAVLDFKKL